MSVSSDLEILETTDGVIWTDCRCPLNKLQGHPRKAKTSRIIIVNHGDVQVRYPTRMEEMLKPILAPLQKSLPIPRDFWVPMLQNATGYFNAVDRYEQDGVTQVYETWMRILIKVPYHGCHADGATVAPEFYVWYHMAFFTQSYTDGSLVAYCFCLPEMVRTHLKQALADDGGMITPSTPFSFYAFMLDHLKPIFDESIWKCRDLIRFHEMYRPTAADSKKDYNDLHEIARHAIHISQCHQNMLNMLDAMMVEHDDFPYESGQYSTKRQVERHFRFHKTLLQSLHGHSKTLEARISNELSLAFHLNSQHDSMLSSQIARSTQEDSAAMRTISVLGLVFLPGTFISSLFSMSFFTVSARNGQEEQTWWICTEFWIYWAVVIPVTTLTILVWHIWYKQKMKRPLGQMHSTTTHDSAYYTATKDKSLPEHSGTFLYELAY